MIRTIADQYLAQNAGRRYPFADDAGYDGVPRELDAAILDFRCTLRGVPVGEAPRAWLTGVSRGADGTTLTVTTERSGATDTLAFAIPADPVTDLLTAAAQDAATGAEGWITVSQAVHAVEPGVTAVPFARTTVVCDALKVESVQSAQDAADARDKDDPATGFDPVAVLAGGDDGTPRDIVLAEGRNAEPYLDGNRLRLDVRRGGGLGERCQSAVSGGQRCNTVLFTINGERPGSDGELKIVGDDGVKVTPDPGNHKVRIEMDAVAAGRMADGCASACQ